ARGGGEGGLRGEATLPAGSGGSVPARPHPYVPAAAGVSGADPDREPGRGPPEVSLGHVLAERGLPRPRPGGGGACRVRTPSPGGAPRPRALLRAAEVAGIRHGPHGPAEAGV